MNDTTKPAGLALLRVPFEAHQIGKLPKPYKKDAPKGNCKECGGYHGLPAAHLDYVGHAATTDRLLDADPAWYWEPMAFTAEGLPKFDDIGGLWIKLTVCGVTRLGYGNAEKKGYSDMGTREKEVIGDALRNAAMRFGAALDLWHKGDLHGGSPDDDASDADRDTQETRDSSDSQAPPSGRAEVPPYPADKFAENFPAWKAAIEAGSKTIDEVINTVRTRGKLNRVQEAKIRSVAAKS